MPSGTLFTPSLITTPEACVEGLEWQGRTGQRRIDSVQNLLFYFDVCTVA